MLLREVEVAVGDAARHHRNAEEALHRRVVWREPHGPGIGHEIVESQRARIGYQDAEDPSPPREIADAIDTIQSHTTSAPATFAQWAAIAALQGDQQIMEDMRQDFDLRRGYMMGRFNKISNVSIVEPKGAFYFLVNIGRMGIGSVNFAEKLLSRMHVAVVPGIAFGADDTVRFSYACSLDVIKKGLDRFEEFCRAH